MLRLLLGMLCLFSVSQGFARRTLSGHTVGISRPCLAPGCSSFQMMATKDATKTGDASKKTKKSNVELATTKKSSVSSKLPVGRSSKLLESLPPKDRDQLVSDIATQLTVMMGGEMIGGGDSDPGKDPQSRDNYHKLIDGVVRIYCTHSEPNYGMPWQRLKQDSSTSSGFIIGSNRILTNAHAVEYGSLIQVKKRQSEKKYVASVIAVGHECDLAILSVDDPTFWEQTEPLVFGDIPDLLEDVSVVGYPVGGDSISISSGVVSRIEMQEYAQASAQLLAIQIDAAINPGNSGGPVVNGDTYEVVGVAFQSLSEEDIENIGYVVPVNVIDHFLEEVERYGRFAGVCEAGLKLQGMDSIQLRSHFMMSPEETGVLIIDVTPLSPSWNLLFKGDVLLSIDGVSIANDGSIPFKGSTTSPNKDRRNTFKERVQLNYYFSQLFPDDVVSFKVLRQGKEVIVKAPVWIPQRLIPRNILQNNYINIETNAGTGNGSIVGGVPSYLIIGGLVMVSLSREYLEDECQVNHMGAYDHWAEEFGLLSRVNDYKESPGQEIVLLSQVLAHNCNIGYENAKNIVLSTVNGQKVNNLQHLRDIIALDESPTSKKNKKNTTSSGDKTNKSSKAVKKVAGKDSGSSGKDGIIVFEFSNGRVIVLDKAAAVCAQEQIRKEHFIPSDCSPDLLSNSGDDVTK